MKISKLYEDHTNIISKINILRQLCKDAIAANSTEISTHLNQLSTDIGVHLNFEDKYVYPVLRKSSNAAVVALATSYQREMAPLLADYQTFAFKFNTAKAIKNNEETFRNQANIVFKALFERIGRENKELYPMAALLDGFQ
jgi:hemerythrin-like domain-containing protein